MKKLIILLLLSTILVSNSRAQQAAQASMAEAKIQIDATNQTYFQAFAKGDSSLFINCFTKDSWIMLPNAASLCGVDAPLEFFKIAYIKSGLRSGRFITIDLFGNGDGYITEEGFWQTFDAVNKPLDSGKFLVLWKKTDDGWKRFRDSFSSDRQPKINN